LSCYFACEFLSDVFREFYFALRIICRLFKIHSHKILKTPIGYLMCRLFPGNVECASNSGDKIMVGMTEQTGR
jgi:hypothetical protein